MVSRWRICQLWRPVGPASRRRAASTARFPPFVPFQQHFVTAFRPGRGAREFTPHGAADARGPCATTGGSPCAVPQIAPFESTAGPLYHGRCPGASGGARLAACVANGSGRFARAGGACRPSCTTAVVRESSCSCSATVRSSAGAASSCAVTRSPSATSSASSSKPKAGSHPSHDQAVAHPAGRTAVRAPASVQRIHQRPPARDRHRTARRPVQPLEPADRSDRPRAAVGREIAIGHDRQAERCELRPIPLGRPEHRALPPGLERRQNPRPSAGRPRLACRPRSRTGRREPERRRARGARPPARCCARATRSRGRRRTDRPADPRSVPRRIRTRLPRPASAAAAPARQGLSAAQRDARRHPPQPTRENR